MSLKDKDISVDFFILLLELEREAGERVTAQTIKVLVKSPGSGFCPIKQKIQLLLLNEGRDTEDMWILRNANKCKDFDDVVLYRKIKPNNRTIYLIQLKHEDSGKNLLLKQFTEEKGKFSLAKYSKSLRELKTDIDNPQMKEEEITRFLRSADLNLVFALYTNKNVKMESEQNQSNSSYKNKTPLLKVENNENCVDKINTNGGTIYKFNYVDLEVIVPDDLKSYHDNFYLFVNQVSINYIDQLIVNEIRNLFANMKLSAETLKEIARKYVDFITQWAKGNLGGYYPLTKTGVVNKLAEIIFNNYLNIKRFNSKTYNLQSKSLLDTKWESILGRVPVTVVDSDSQIKSLLYEYIYSQICFICPKLHKLNSWSAHFSSTEKSDFYNDYKELKEAMLGIIGNYGKITLLDVYKCLWKTGRIQLILEAEDIIDYVNIMETIKFLRKFANVSFIIMIDTSKNKLPKINDLPDIFFNLDNLSDGEKRKILLEKIKFQGKSSNAELCIRRELYLHITVKDIIDILLGSFTVGNYFQKLPIYFIKRYVTKPPTNPSSIKLVKELYDFLVSFFSNDASEKDACSEVLKIYQEYSENYDKIDNYLNHKVIVLSAGPGMGKSTLMDYIAFKIPATKYVLKIKLKEHLDYYEKREFQNSKLQIIEYLCHFNKHMLIKHKCYNVLNEEIFCSYAKAGDVVVILDGFDEISLTHKKEVTQLAKCLLSGISSLWIVTRPSMKAYLEETFNIPSISLNPFNEDDQIKFLTKFYLNCFDKMVIRSMHVTRKVIKKFVLHLLEITKKKLNKWDYEFTRTPLHARLLAEVFKTNCVEYNQTRAFTVTEHFDLLYLYEEFIRQKREILAEKVNKQCVSLFRNTHEYLAAQWIYENCLEGKNKMLSENLLKKTFEPPYQVLRNIFDRMMAKNLELHKAIIGLQFDQ
ncbi:hypothetical protein ILUMI_19711, partial [Ignelater luminosus]